MQAQYGERELLFLRAFSKNVLKRQIIIFHLASGNKMSDSSSQIGRAGGGPKVVPSAGSSSHKQKPGGALVFIVSLQVLTKDACIW